MRTIDRTKLVCLNFMILFLYTSIAVADGEWVSNDGGDIYNTNFGNVGIGTTNPGQALDIEGNLELNGSLIGGVSSARAYYNLLAARWGRSQTGALVIQTNVPQDDHTMTQTKVILKSKYSSGSTGCEYLISGYWSTEANGGFSGRGYRADCSDIQRIRFIRNSGNGKVAIVIGENTSTWSHPMVAVPEFLAHYGIASDDYANGWTASIVSSLSGYINSDDVGNTSPIHETANRVGIGTTNPGQALDIEGNLELNGSLIGGVSSARAYYNLLAARWGRSQTGALVIQTNVPQDDHTMTQTKVILKSKYSSGSTGCEYLISGYWSTEANGGFSGRGYRADCSDIQRIRFMRNSGNGKVAIVIGENTSTWSHPMVAVPEFLAHYGIASDDYANGWTASIVSSLSGYINSDEVGNTSPIHETANRVGIGTTDPKSKLAVNGTITAKEIKVESGWSDFVFDENYDLASLDEVESFIRENKHLPDIPSAKEVKQEGLAVSDMLAKQMQKIEEMILYLIELKQENNLIKATIADQNKQLASLKELQARIEAIEKRN